MYTMHAYWTRLRALSAAETGSDPGAGTPSAAWVIRLWGRMSGDWTANTDSNAGALPQVSWSPRALRAQRQVCSHSSGR